MHIAFILHLTGGQTGLWASMFNKDTNAEFWMNEETSEMPLQLMENVEGDEQGGGGDSGEFGGNKNAPAAKED